MADQNNPQNQNTGVAGPAGNQPAQPQPQPGVAQPSVPQGETPQQPEQQGESRIVQATGVAAGMHTGAPKSDLAGALEKAMTEAAASAHRDGLTNPDEIRGRILAARDQVMNTPPQTGNQ